MEDIELDLCNWCGEALINKQAGWKWTCEDCTFTCPDCKESKPLELGGGDCQSCDVCCFEHEEDTHIEY